MIEGVDYHSFVETIRPSFAKQKFIEIRHKNQSRISNYKFQFWYLKTANLRNKVPTSSAKAGPCNSNEITRPWKIQLTFATQRCQLENVQRTESWFPLQSRYVTGAQVNTQMKAEEDSRVYKAFKPRVKRAWIKTSGKRRWYLPSFFFFPCLNCSLRRGQENESNKETGRRATV